jgi:dihydrofolate reductase
MNINLISAMDSNRGIGYQNELLCHLPGDLKNFKKLTLNKPIVMGRKTWESLGSKPLPKRTNIVLSSNNTSCEITLKSIDDFLFYAHENKLGDIYVIGGSSIYEQFLPITNRIYLTTIQQQFDNVDSFFPKIILDEWGVNHDSVEKTEGDSYAWRFQILDRKQS